MSHTDSSLQQISSTTSKSRRLSLLSWQLLGTQAKMQNSSLQRLKEWPEKIAIRSKWWIMRTSCWTQKITVSFSSAKASWSTSSINSWVSQTWRQSWIRGTRDTQPSVSAMINEVKCYISSLSLRTTKKLASQKETVPITMKKIVQS